MKKPLFQPRRTLSAAFSALLGLYLVLLLFPEITFGHKQEYGPFVVYAHQPLPESLPAVLDSAQKLLQASEFNRAEPARYPLFFCSSFGEYAFFSPGAARAFANNNFLTGKIMFANPQVAANLTWCNAPENNQRSLSGTIAHEVTHTILRRELGFLQELQLETWKREGYCDAVARESSYGYEKGLAHFCQPENPSAPSFQYFKYRLLVEHLLNQNQTFTQLAGQPYDLEALERTVKKQLCR